MLGGNAGNRQGEKGKNQCLKVIGRKIQSGGRKGGKNFRNESALKGKNFANEGTTLLGGVWVLVKKITKKQELRAKKKTRRIGEIWGG